MMPASRRSKREPPSAWMSHEMGVKGVAALQRRMTRPRETTRRVLRSELLGGPRYVLCALEPGGTVSNLTILAVGAFANRFTLDGWWFSSRPSFSFGNGNGQMTIPPTKKAGATVHSNEDGSKDAFGGWCRVF